MNDSPLLCRQFTERIGQFEAKGLFIRVGGGSELGNQFSAESRMAPRSGVASASSESAESSPDSLSEPSGAEKPTT